MYPGKNDPAYGIFVSNFVTLLGKEGCEFPYRAVIIGRSRNPLIRIRRYLSFFVKVFYLSSKDDYDLVYVHYIAHSLIPLLFIKGIIKKPLVINAHGSDVLSNTKLNKFIQKLVSSIIIKADLIVVPSEYFKNVVMEKYEISKNRLYISPSSGVNLDIFRPSDGRSHEKFTIGYVSRIDEGKGWNVLLNAVKIIVEKGLDNIELLIIGGGSQERILKDMVSRYQLCDQVKVIGVIAHDKLYIWYNKMDVFVFPTERSAESLGLVGLEAMACGVPVIGSDIGGLKGYVETGINGELFPPGDVDALVLALEKFILLSETEIKLYRLQASKTALRYDSKQVAISLRKKLLQVIEAQ